MARRTRKRYPGTDDSFRDDIYRRSRYDDEEPDFINGAPNWDKFEAWDVDEVLVWLNID